jgi:hypothetical protein
MIEVDGERRRGDHGPLLDGPMRVAEVDAEVVGVGEK